MMLPLVWLCMVAGLLWAAIAFSSYIPYLIGGGLIALFACWSLVSTLSPAIPDRKCPRCGRDGLIKIRKGEPGIRCEHCDFRDETLHVAYLDEW